MSAVSMAVDLGGIKMRNPINTASGTFGFGWQFENLMNVSSLGAITCKGCAAEAWLGNPAPRMAEVTSGMLNSLVRSEERRVGKEGSSRWSPDH